jgi:hypothetical protein
MSTYQHTKHRHSRESGNPGLAAVQSPELKLRPIMDSRFRGNDAQGRDF